MPTTKKPMGMEPLNNGENPLLEMRVGASAPSAIAFNDPVAFNTAGGLAPASAATDYAIGVAQGFRYIDSTTKKPTWAKSLAAGTSSADSNIWALVQRDQNQLYVVVADATVSYGDVGLNFELSGVGVPDTNGRSTAVLKASTRTSASKLVRLIEPHTLPDNNFGSDAYPYVVVRFVQHNVYRTSAF